MRIKTESEVSLLTDRCRVLDGPFGTTDLEMGSEPNRTGTYWDTENISGTRAEPNRTEPIRYSRTGTEQNPPTSVSHNGLKIHVGLRWSGERDSDCLMVFYSRTLGHFGCIRSIILLVFLFDDDIRLRLLCNGRRHIPAEDGDVTQGLLQNTYIH